MKVERQAVLQDVLPLSTGDASGKQMRYQVVPNEEGTAEPGSARQGNAAQKEPGREDIIEAVKLGNEAIKVARYHLEFTIEEEIDRYQVKVVNSDSGEVIREIPPDYMIEFIKNVKRCMDDAIGMILDETA